MRLAMKCTLFVSLLAVLFSVALLPAQTFRGGVQGTVTDTSGASVSGALVTVTSPGTGLTRSAQTDDSGAYSFTELPPGAYNVTVTKQGFQKQTLTNVHVPTPYSVREKCSRASRFPPRFR